jgi:hypothetical protein
MFLFCYDLIWKTRILVVSRRAIAFFCKNDTFNVYTKYTHVDRHTNMNTSIYIVDK